MDGLIEYQLVDRREEFTYLFSDVVLICTRPRDREYTVWYINCPHCGKRHRFVRTGKKYWHTACETNGVQFVITPREYHETKPVDFSKVIGDI